MIALNRVQSRRFVKLMDIIFLKVRRFLEKAFCSHQVRKTLRIDWFLILQLDVSLHFCGFVSVVNWWSSFKIFYTIALALWDVLFALFELFFSFYWSFHAWNMSSLRVHQQNRWFEHSAIGISSRTDLIGCKFLVWLFLVCYSRACLV